MPMVCRLKFYLFLLFTLELCYIAENHQHRRGIRQLSSSIRFTRRIRSRIQTLLLHYKKQELGDSEFEDRHLILKTLPSLNTDYFTWLHMLDTERLKRALQDLHVFLIHLDANRKQIEEERSSQTDALTRSMYRVQLDMQDLLLHIKSQLKQMSSQDNPSGQTVTKQPLPPSMLQPQRSWHKRLQGYVVLRDLEQYLGKLTRDFMLLKSRYGKYRDASQRPLQTHNPFRI